jgi:hypothetical protein
MVQPPISGIYTISLHNLFSDQLPKEIYLYKNPEVLGIIYIYLQGITEDKSSKIWCKYH